MPGRHQDQVVRHGTISGAVPSAGPIALRDTDGRLVAGFGTIQMAVDAASDGCLVRIPAGKFCESVDVTAALRFVGAGAGRTVVVPLKGSAFAIGRDLGAGSSVSFEDIEVRGAPRSGIQLSGGAQLDGLVVAHCRFEANGRSGVEVIGNGLADTIIEDSVFVGNGLPSGAGGGSDILFLWYDGDALIRDVGITGLDRGGGAERHGIQLRGDGGAIGMVTLENVTVSGTFEQQAVAVVGYEDTAGLQISGVEVCGEPVSKGQLDAPAGSGDLPSSRSRRP